jgi:hypothetical protein
MLDHHFVWMAGVDRPAYGTVGIEHRAAIEDLVLTIAIIPNNSETSF